MANLSGVIDELGAQFGALDNTVEKWIPQGEALADLFPQIAASLEAQFPPGSAPMRTFSQATGHYRRLLAGLEPLARGYLNLRFYIMLNGFLSACRESLEKAAWNESLDPAELVAKSYYTPYFFDRAVITSDDALQMLEADLGQLQAASRDRSGAALAMRIRKGTVSMLAESYCPAQPEIYPAVAALEKVSPSSDPAVIDQVAGGLTAIQAAIRSQQEASS